MITETIKKLSRSLVFRLILAVGLVFFIGLSAWVYLNVRYQQQKVMHHIQDSIDRLSNTIKLGTHYAMMLNSRDDINQIINNIGKQGDIVNLRIYNKAGEIKFSNDIQEVDRATNIKAEACDICHHVDPPPTSLDLDDRTRFFTSPKGYRLLGIISPIYNEEGCATDACHEHPANKKVLGALDVVVSLENTDQEIRRFSQGIILLASCFFLAMSILIVFFILHFINQPIRTLIAGTRRIAEGEYMLNIELGRTLSRSDEISQLANAINQMSTRIGEKQNELNRQRDEYQNLFAEVPCIITVQDRNYRLLQYNREFAEKFAPRPGDFCFHAYKGRDTKCPVCPVEKTFKDGLWHTSEESAERDGIESHWFVKTSPIRDRDGSIVAAMEMCLDITDRRLLEKKLEQSEKKYYSIFNNIPNPVFVLDADTFQILDCNLSAETVYGLSKDKLIAKSFIDLFFDEDQDKYTRLLRESEFINRVRHVHAQGRVLFVNIRISPSEYPGQKVLLVTTSDITQRLETEQQLIQAGKMATLGEMATGVAHELNQPLTVIKTASSFIMRKLSGLEAGEAVHTMAGKINTNVDRATRIINHMREFGRKSDLGLVKIQLNNVLEKAFEMFSQQFKVREIAVQWDLYDPLPEIMADAVRLEQVFINLLINARDAIEEKKAAQNRVSGRKKIRIATRHTPNQVIAEIADTGVGIPQALLNKVFEPFYTTKDVGKGTGLGLSISYGIIKDFGGAIYVEPNLDEGVRFVIKLPRMDRDEQ